MSAASESILRRDLTRTLGNLLRTPARLRRLLAFGPKGLLQIARFLFTVVPYASRRLAQIRADALTIPDPELRAQALASIEGKAYHVQGGCILATFLRPQAARRYVEAVVPIETIYDYLDNLCDRLEGVPEGAYATLHGALLDALDPRRPLAEYYRDGPHRDDGGYLLGLVQQSRTALALLPSLEAVTDRILESAALYTELQTYKHLPPSRREEACRAWFERNRMRAPGMAWWEFAAAAGSSLPVFAMLFLASHDAPREADVGATYHVYFPALSAIHILLDYFIDQAEDREHGELNFFAMYPSPAEGVERIRAAIGAVLVRAKALPDGEAHAFLLRSMALFYLTHPKVFEQGLETGSALLLSALD